MKVKDLIKTLQSADPDTEVIIQADSEGNGYSPCAGAELAIYVPDSSWGGEVYNLDSNASNNCLEEKEWKKIKENKKNRCVVLWPVN